MISGPSGVGKSTVCSALLKLPKFERVVTCTTRRPRPGEENGRHYHFMERKEFEEGIGKNQFLEHAVVHDQLYGAPKHAVEESICKGKFVLLNIDVKGAAQLRELKLKQEAEQRSALARMTTVFLVPPDAKTLERRLEGRGTDNKKEMASRLETARKEMLEKDKYDHVVVNGDLAETVGKILELIGYDRSTG